MVGAGSVGWAIAVYLAEAGVGAFVLFDNDALDAANLSRHACGLHDLGRRKVDAVAELVRERAATGYALHHDILALADHGLDARLSGADLVIASTDSPAVQFLVNESCVRLDIPALFVGAYERAVAGEVIAVRSGGPCLFCAVGFRTGVAPGVETKERRLAYQDADGERLEAEPGLGADIAFLSSVASAHALALLDPEGSRRDLLPAGSFLLVHGGSQPEGALAEIFERPFEFVRARVTRTEPCPVCGFMGGEEE